MKKKWAIVVTVSCFTFISPVSSSMVAPALTTLARDLGITDAIESQLTLSIFVLAYAFGPLFLGPLSEIYGRMMVLQLANLFYLVFNIACGVAKTKAQMIVFRFFAGLGGSAPLAVRVSRRFVIMFVLTVTDWRWRFIRLLPTRRTRQECCHLQSCPPPRSSSRPYCRWIYRREHDLALGVLCNHYRRRRHSDRRLDLLEGDLRAQDSASAGKKTPQGDRRSILPNRSRAPEKDPQRDHPLSSHPPLPPPVYATHRPSHCRVPRLHLRNNVPRPLHVPDPLDGRTML